MWKVKHLIVIILTISFITHKGISQPYRFKKAFHLYGTKQTEAFLYELKQLEKSENVRFEHPPDYVNSEGTKVFDIYEADGYKKRMFFKRTINPKKDGTYIFASYTNHKKISDKETRDYIRKLAREANFQYTKVDKKYEPWHSFSFSGKDGAVTYIPINDGGLIIIKIAETFFSKSMTSISNDIKGRFSVTVKKEGGVYIVTVNIGGKDVEYIVDSGAADISLSESMEDYLLSIGVIRKEDYLTSMIYKIADGSTIERRRVKLKSVKIGEIVVNDIIASIIKNSEPLLLGNSFLNKFKSWSIDPSSQRLIIEL